MRVDEIMSAEVVTVAPETSLREVAVLLSRHGISGAPVCDERRRILGVVSEADVIRIEQGLEPARGGLWRFLVGRLDGAAAKLSARTAGEAMTAPPIVIEAGSAVAEAARTMTLQQVNRLPVVRDGRLVGIVTRADLVRAFHRSGDEIRREIAAEVLDQFWVDRSRLELEVEDGVVTLRGQVGNRSEADLVVAHIRPIPGVVEVRSELTWDVDDRARRTSASADNLPRRI